MSDPAIEPQSGISYKVLFERLWRLYLSALEDIRELTDLYTKRS